MTGCIVLVKEYFFFSFVTVFRRFLPSNALIMLYSIRYWWFFSQGNRWTKYLAYPKIRKTKSSLMIFVSLVILDSFHLQVSTQLTADLTPEWSGGSMFHPLSHIYEKKLLLVVLKQLQTTLWIVDRLFLIDCEQTWHPLWTQLSYWQMFMQNGEYTAFWSSLTLLLSHATSIYDWLKWVCGVFFGVFRDNWRIGRPERSASFVSVRQPLKSA